MEPFEDAFVRLYPLALAVAGRIVMVRAAAEDVAAEALARAYERWGRLASHPNVDAWVLRVTINLAVSAVRRLPPPAVLAVLVDDPGESVVLRLALSDALRRLPRRQREAVALRYLAGFSERDVSTVLRCAPGTLKSHLHRALTKLRVEVGDFDDVTEEEEVRLALEG